MGGGQAVEKKLSNNILTCVTIYYLDIDGWQVAVIRTIGCLNFSMLTI